MIHQYISYMMFIRHDVTECRRAESYLAHLSRMFISIVYICWRSWSATSVTESRRGQTTSMEASTLVSTDCPQISTIVFPNKTSDVLTIGLPYMFKVNCNCEVWNPLILLIYLFSGKTYCGKCNWNLHIKSRERCMFYWAELLYLSESVIMSKTWTLKRIRNEVVSVR